MAVQFSPISRLHPQDHAVARAPAARPPTNRPPGVQTELAPHLAAATLAATSAGGTSTGTTAAPAAPNFNTLFPLNAPTTPAAPPSSGPPTAQSVFGTNPWIEDAGGTGPTGAFSLNPMYFATPETAARVASMVGGTVVQVDTFAQASGNPFHQNVPNQMVRLTNGALINPGLVAEFYTHGYPQSMIDRMIANEVANVSAGT
jgi:hypothetical protein